MKRLLAQRSPSRRPRTSTGRGESGQAAFEFLLIMPLFILIILLLVDFGIVMYGYVSVANATREGARYAAVNCADGTCTQAEVQSWTSTHSTGFLSSAQVTVQWSAAARGSDVSVRANRPHAMLFFPTTIPILSCTHMRLEQGDGGTLGTFGAGC